MKNKKFKKISILSFFSIFAFSSFVILLNKTNNIHKTHKQSILNSNNLYSSTGMSGSISNNWTKPDFNHDEKTSPTHLFLLPKIDYSGFDFTKTSEAGYAEKFMNMVNKVFNRFDKVLEFYDLGYADDSKALMKKWSTQRIMMLGYISAMEWKNAEDLFKEIVNPDNIEKIEKRLNKMTPIKISQQDEITIKRPEDMYLGPDLTSQVIPKKIDTLFSDGADHPFAYKVISTPCKESSKFINTGFKFGFQVEVGNDSKSKVYKFTFNNFNSLLTNYIRDNYKKKDLFKNLIRKGFLKISNSSKHGLTSLAPDLEDLPFIRFNLNADFMNIFIVPQKNQNYKIKLLKFSNAAPTGLNFGFLDNSLSNKHLNQIPVSLYSNSDNILNPLGWNPYDSSDLNKLFKDHLANLSMEQGKENEYIDRQFFKYTNNISKKYEAVPIFIHSGSSIQIPFYILGNQRKSKYTSGRTYLFINWKDPSNFPLLTGAITINEEGKEDAKKARLSIYPINFYWKKGEDEQDAQWARLIIMLPKGLIRFNSNTSNLEAQESLAYQNLKLTNIKAPPTHPNNLYSLTCPIEAEKDLKISDWKTMLDNKSAGIFKNCPITPPTSKVDLSKDALESVLDNWMGKSYLDSEQKLTKIDTSILPIIGAKLTHFNFNYKILQRNDEIKLNYTKTKNSIMTQIGKDSDFSKKHLLGNKTYPKNPLFIDYDKSSFPESTGANIIKQFYINLKMINEWAKDIKWKIKGRSGKKEGIEKLELLFNDNPDKKTVGEEHLGSNFLKESTDTMHYFKIILSYLSRLENNQLIDRDEQLIAQDNKMALLFKAWENGTLSNFISSLSKFPLVKSCADVLLQYSTTPNWDKYKTENTVEKQVTNAMVNDPSGQPKYKQIKIANNIIYRIIEPFVSKVLEEILNNYLHTFDNIKSGILSSYMVNILNKSISDNFSAINSKILKNFKNSSLPSELSGLHLIALNQQGLYKVDTFKKQLSSLINFIFNNKLETAFLSLADSEKFKNLKDNFIKPESYSGSTGIDMIDLLSKIIDKVLDSNKSTNNLSLKQIINKISSGCYTGEAGHKKVITDIKSIFDKSIKTIVSKKQDYKYHYFGGQATSSYIQKLVMGTNIRQVIKIWIKHQDKLKIPIPHRFTIESMCTEGIYDTKILTQIAINVGYYNLGYFVKSCSDSNLVVSTMYDLYNSNLSKTLTFTLPEGNKLITVLSKPEMISNITFMIIGSMLLCISLFSIFVSFSNSFKDKTKVSTILLMRTVFVIILLIGLGIISLGLIGLI